AADPWVQGVGLLRLGAALTLAAWAAALALLVAGGAGRGALVFHDYRDSFPRQFRLRTPALLAALVVVTLWSVGTGPALFLLLSGLALSPYYPRSARWALGVCLGVGCLLGWTLGSLSSVAGQTGERAWALYRVWRGDAGEPLMTDLQRLFPENDPRAAFARSRVARREHQFQEAATLLEQALVLPDAPRAMLYQELGTLRFLQGNTEAALREFEQAAVAAPNDPLPWLNRHVVHLDRLELGLADEALARARTLGGPAVDRAQRRFTEASRHIVPAAPAMPPTWVREELWKGAGVSSPWVGELSRGLFAPIHVFDPTLLGFLALGVLLPIGYSGAGRRSHRCPSCGFVVCPRCGRRVKEVSLCPACWAAGREEAADSTEKERQAAHVAAWQARRKRWRRVGGILLPGWSDFVARSGVGQLALGVLWASMAGWAALVLLYPLGLLPWSSPASPWIPAAGIALAHGIGLWLAMRRPHTAKG
ncbi:MAG: hypothetical protein IH608_02265, partial [Proteobacteria bacterium]|nr:hypothetical protein [Pseudomonadota bacterium]